MSRGASVRARRLVSRRQCEVISLTGITCLMEQAALLILLEGLSLSFTLTLDTYT